MLKRTFITRLTATAVLVGIKILINTIYIGTEGGKRLETAEAKVSPCDSAAAFVKALLPANWGNFPRDRCKRHVITSRASKGPDVLRNGLLSLDSVLQAAVAC